MSSLVCTHTCVLSGLEPTRRMRMIMYPDVPPEMKSPRRDP